MLCVCVCVYPGRIWPDLLDCKTRPWPGFLQCWTKENCKDLILILKTFRNKYTGSQYELNFTKSTHI